MPDDTQDIARTVAYLAAMTDDRFVDALRDRIGDPDPDPIEVAAFRSPELAERTLIALNYALREMASIEATVGRDSTAQKRRARQAYRSLLSRERAFVETIVNELNARKGIARNASNPRRRALERLAQLNYAGDVPRGKFKELYDEERQKDTDARRAARAAARARQRER